ncbi:unnamed protein product [Prorocentrum cordatum]|uniref:CCHC-type domain-containing protein n=1 Tax=Prorocentrum cordatum TaxID=2364126 RepID=A0ABN9ST66_9DINO|nr:unnamed protein product [Polarella glacialis]
MAAVDVVDVRTDMRLQRFDGTDQKWGGWSLRFEACTAHLGFEEFMTAAGQRQDPLLNDQLDERARQASQRLWHPLITYCEGKAMGVVKRSRQNGLEAWRQLKNAVSDNVRVSVLLEHAPDPHREVLRQAPEEVKLTFSAARSHIRGYYNQGRTFTHVPDAGGVVPMQVDAVRAQPPNGKASGKRKTGKADKSGGKSGKLQKGKDPKTNSKARNGGKHGKGQTEYFDGECGYCGKWGHKRADCRKKKADDAKKEAGHTRAVQGDAPSSSGQQPADGTARAASGYYDGTPDGWVFAVTAGTDGKVAKVGGSILIDSGNDDHLCRHRFVPEAPVSSAVDAPRLFDVQQRPLPTAGLRGVEMAMKEGTKATADFLVADVNDDLLSMGKLLGQGFKFNLSLVDGLYMTKGHRSVQLELERNSLRPPIVPAGPAAEARHCRGAAERQDAATAPVLNADSSVGATRARLRELFMPIYGTRAELWDRLIVPDAAVKRSEPERAHKQGSERTAPLISYDFGFCKTADEGGDLTKVEDTCATMFAGFSSDAEVAKVLPCPSKSASPYEIAGIKSFAQRLETGKCRPRTDSEPATKAILDGVAPREIATGAPYKGDICHFGETVLHRRQTDKDLLLSVTGLPWATRTAPERSRRRRAAPHVATEILRADEQQQQQAPRQAGPPEGGAGPAQPQASPQAPPAAAAGPPQPQPQPQQPAPPAPGDAAMGAPPSQAARRGLPPETEASESKRARVAAVNELGVGNVDDSPDAFWEEISDEVEDPTDGMFEVDAQDEMDKKLTLEHLQSLLDHGVGEDTPKPEAREMKHITTRWEKQWRWKPARQEWQRRVRFVCREFRWQEWRDDLFTPGSAPISNRLIDFVALKRGFEVMTLDATDAFYQAPEHEDAVVDPPQEYLDMLQAECRSTDIYWRLKKQLPGRRKAAPGWVEHMAGILADEMPMARCEVAPQFFYNSETEVVVELHMDDLRMAGPRGALEGFRDELGQHVTFSGGEIHEYGTTYEHLKGEPETLGLGNSNTAPTPGVPAHKALMGGTSALSPVQAGIYRSCVGALMYYAQDRAGCQYEVSLLGRMLSGPTVGAFTALKRLVRYLLGTRDAVNWLPWPTEGANVELVGCGDSDWAGDLQTRRSQTSGKIEIDNVPMHSFSRRQGIVATSSGVAEYYAGAAVAEDLLYFKSLLEFMGFTVVATLLTDSSAARGIAKRERVGKVRSLEARVLWLQQAIKRKLMDLGTAGTDDNKADLGTKILGHERFVKLRTMNGIYTDMGQVAESDHQSEEVDFDVGAATRVRRARGAATSPGVSRSAALAMITAAVTLLQGCEGPATEYDGYYDTEVCSKDGVVASDWTSYWLVVVVWTLVAATVCSYAGFRYANWGESEWLLVSPEPDDVKDKKIDAGISCVSAPSMVEQSNQTRRTVGTQSQTTYKWR